MSFIVLYYVHGFFVALFETKRFTEYLNMRYWNASSHDRYDWRFSLPLSFVGAFIWPVTLLQENNAYQIPKP